MLPNWIKTRTKIKSLTKIFSSTEAVVTLVNNHSKGQLQTFLCTCQRIWQLIICLTCGCMSLSVFVSLALKYKCHWQTHSRLGRGLPPPNYPSPTHSVSRSRCLEQCPNFRVTLNVESAESAESTESVPIQHTNYWSVRVRPLRL